MNKKYISPLVPKDFIPCDWNEGDAPIEVNTTKLDNYIRGDVESHLKKYLYAIMELPSSLELKITPGSDNGLLYTISFGAFHGYKYFRMRKNDYAQVKDFALATNLKFEQTNNSDLFSELKQETIVYFSNPCNPTCELISPTKIETICRENPSCLFLLDNAYIEYHQESNTTSLAELPNLVIFRTFSKFWGLAGIRLGTIFFNRNCSLAEHMGVLNSKHISALHDSSITEIFKRKDEITTQRANESKNLEKLAHSIADKFNITFKKAGNFVLLDCKDGLTKDAVNQYFFQYKIAIRDLSHLEDFEYSLRFNYRKEAFDLMMADLI